MASSHNALTQADREAYGYDEQPSSSDLAAGKPSGPPQNPFGQNAPNMNDPRPKKDGADNSPLKDGSKNPPKKTYGPGQAVSGQVPSNLSGSNNK